MSDLVRYEINYGVAVVTIDNPPVNALSPTLWEGIEAAVLRASADSAEAIVLIGAGTTFIAGADIRVFETLKTAQDSLVRSARTHALLRNVEDAPKPLVAAIHGYALGGGLEVAQACHFRVATSDARVGQPEGMLGTRCRGHPAAAQAVRRQDGARDVRRRQARSGGHGAVPSGARIRARIVPGSVSEVAGSIQVVWNVTIEREHADKPACVAEWIVRYDAR